MSARAASLAVTATGIGIGIAHQRPAVRLQAALLEPRTARPLPALQRVLVAAWRWL